MTRWMDGKWNRRLLFGCLDRNGAPVLSSAAPLKTLITQP